MMYTDWDRDVEFVGYYAKGQFVEDLWEVLERRGMSVEDLCRVLGRDRRWVGRLLSDDPGVSIRVLGEVAAVLGVRLCVGLGEDV